MEHLRIGLIGDRNDDVVAHRAIPVAIARTAQALGVDVQPHWLPTATINDDAALWDCDALWCVPASPYESTDGALRAIRFAREHGRPFLGTCGGFQHALLEYSRNVLGLSTAEHEEMSPTAETLVITRLACPLVDVAGDVHFAADSRIAAAYASTRSREEYRCSFGLDAAIETRIFSSGLRCTARDETGDVRAVELDDHPFFVATLFQPERAALKGTTPPLVVAFARAAVAQRDARPAT